MKVSIIIATFNVENDIHIALDSVISQKFNDWECIIVDGLSSDNTIEIVKSYCIKDSRIRYISESDQGIYDAFNKGCELAKGEYIYFLGSDDKVHPDAFANIFSKNLNYDIIYGNIFFETSKKIKHIIYKPNPSQLKYGCFSHQATLMKKQAIKKLGGFNLEYKIVSDYDLLLRAYLSKMKFKHVNTDIAYFRAINGVSSNQKGFFTEAYYVRKNLKSTPTIINFLLSLKKKVLNLI